MKQIAISIREKELQLSKLKEHIDKSEVCSDLYNKILVEKAGINDLPCGVVAGNPVKVAFNAGEYVSIFPIGCFVYMQSEYDIKSGDKINVDCEVASQGEGVIGIAWNNIDANGLFIMQVVPEIFEQGLENKQDNINLGEGLQFVDPDAYAWEGEIPGDEIVYTLSDTLEATGNTVYYLENGKYEKERLFIK